MVDKKVCEKLTEETGEVELGMMPPEFLEEMKTEKRGVKIKIIAGMISIFISPMSFLQKEHHGEITRTPCRVHELSKDKP